MGARTNYAAMLGKQHGDTPEDCAEAAHAQRRIPAVAAGHRRP